MWLLGILSYAKSVTKFWPLIPSSTPYFLTPGDVVPYDILSPTSTVSLFYVPRVECNKILYYFHVLLFGLGFIFLFWV